MFVCLYVSYAFDCILSASRCYCVQIQMWCAPPRNRIQTMIQMAMVAIHSSQAQSQVVMGIAPTQGQLAKLAEVTKVEPMVTKMATVQMKVL